MRCRRQYDLHSPDIESSIQLISEYDGFATSDGFKTRFNAMALAPDNKIYMCCTNGAHYLHVIHALDMPGVSCDFRQHDVDLPTNLHNLLPNFPNFRLYDWAGSPCDTIGVSSIDGTGTGTIRGIQILPNPATES